MQGEKVLLFPPLNLCWKSEEHQNTKETELEPCKSSHPLKDLSILQLCLCTGKTTAALCTAEAGQGCQHISFLVCITVPDLTQIIKSNHRVWIQIWFWASQKIAEIEILQLMILRISLPSRNSLLVQTKSLCLQCWWLLNYTCRTVREQMLLK